MATSANRDVKMTLSIETLGEDGIKDLQKSIANLAKEGGEAAPEFQRLADEVGRLGEQNQALSSFTNLAEATRVLSDRQAEAQTSSAKLATDLDSLRAAADAARIKQQQASDALAQQRSVLAEATLALRQNKTGYDAAGNAIQNFRTNTSNLLAVQSAAKLKLDELRAAQTAANAEVSKAEVAQKKAQTAYDRAGVALERTNAALAKNVTETAAAAAAAQTLGVATDNVAGEQARLVAALNATDAAAEQLKQSLAQAAAAVRATADAEREAAVSAKELQTAFNTLNIRSAEQIHAELLQVNSALDLVRARATQTGSTMAGAFTAGQARINALQLELRQLNGTLTLSDRAAGLFKNSLGQIAAGNLVADAVGYLVNKVKESGREFLAANLQIQRFNKALTQIYGNAQTAAQQLEFVRKTANDAGVDVGALSDAFVRFAASSNAAGISLDDTNRVFASVTRAAGTLGLTNEQVTGTLEALGQMASKGTVSMEELRQQLGDRLPGATAIAAKSLGVTTERLIEMVEAGNVSAKVFLPAFADALTETFGQGTGQITGFIQGWNRLSNAIREVAQRASETSIFTTLGAVFDATARNIDKVVLGVTLLAERFLVLKAIDLVGTFVRTSTAVVQNTAATAANTAVTVANTAAKTANSAASAVLVASVSAATAAQTTAAAATGLFGRSLGVLGTAAGVAGGAVRGLTTLVGGLPGVLALVALNARELGTWIGESIAKMGEAGENMRIYEELTRKQAEAEKLAADTKRRLTLEQDRQNLATAEGAVRARKAAEGQVTISEAALKARQAEAQVSATLAAISGREVDALNAAADAAQSTLAATQQVTTAKQELVLRTQEEIAAIELTRDANGKLTEKQQEQVTKLKELLAARQQEALGAKSSADSLALEAVQRRLLAELYQDNSGRLEELNQKYRDAVLLQETLVASGVGTAEQLAQANAKVAASARLVGDGYADAAKNIAAESAVKQANINIAQAGLGVQQSAYDRLAQAARASGDLVQATYYEIEAKRIQIQITRATAEAKNLEAKATIAQVDANRKELEAKGPLTTLQKAELDLRLANAKAKQIEAGASAEIVRALEAEITAIRINADARGAGTRSVDADTASRYKNADSIRAQTAALQEQQLTSDGFKANADGSAAGTFNNSLPMDKAYEIIAKKNAGTLTPEDLADAAIALNQAQNANDWLRSAQDLSAGAVNPQTVFQTAAMAANIKDAIASLKNQQTVDAAATASGAAAGSASTGPGNSGTSHTVKVELGGKSRTVNTASASDASALVAMLRDLETAAGRAS